MFNVRHQQCPQCEQCVSVEDVATEDLHDHMVTFVLCEFCGIGVETLWKKVGDGYEEDFSVTFNEHRDPVKFGKFTQRLLDARAA